MNDRFQTFAGAASQKLGSHWTLMIAVAIVLTWLVTGPLFHFSDPGS